MKSLCCVGLCLLLAVSCIAQEWDFYKNLPDDIVKGMAEHLKKPGVLKKNLMIFFADGHFLWDMEIPLYIKKFDVSEDTLRTVLMEIIKESAEATKWEPYRHDGQEKLSDEKSRLMESIIWLGFCADKPTQEFLMEIVVDETKGKNYRNLAVSAYFRAANAQQIKDAIPRFLTEKRDLLSSVHRHARAAYEEAGDDAAKRAAIVEALTAAALVREEDRGHFAVADKEFAEVDAEYAKSPRRQAALQLLGLQAEKKSFLKSLWR